MSGLNEFCVCEACLDGEGECATLEDLDKHLHTVARLLETDSHSIEVRVGESRKMVMSCPLILLAHYSGVIRREVEKQMKSHKLIRTITFNDEGAEKWSLAFMIQWCFTGRISISAHRYFFKLSFLELLWNLAADLEMPEFANYSMRCMMGKYTHDFVYPGVNEIEYEPLQSPYEPFGLLYVHQHNRTRANRTRLLCFADRLLDIHDPLEATDGMSDSKTNEYLRIWRHFLDEDPSLDRWVRRRTETQMERWWIVYRNEFMVPIEGKPMLWDHQGHDLGETPKGSPVDVTRKLREPQDDIPGHLSNFDCDKPQSIIDLELLEKEYLPLDNRLKALRREEGKLSQKRGRGDEEDNEGPASRKQARR